MTLLELIQQVTDELALDRPQAIVGSQDKQTRQFLALLSRLGNDLCRQFDWQRLDKEHLITTVAYERSAVVAEGSPIVTVDTSNITTNFGLYGSGIIPFAQVVSIDSPTQLTMSMAATASGTYDINIAQVLYPLPSDWMKEVPQTEWDRTNRWPLMGPQSPQDWQSFKSGIVYAGPRSRFRILTNSYAINPPPPDGLIFVMEYISNAWIVSPLGVSISAFASDSDTMIFSDSLLITGLKTQWKLAKGLDATNDVLEFRNLLDVNKAQDKSSPKLTLSPFNGTVLLTQYNIMDGDWGVNGWNA